MQDTAHAAASVHATVMSEEDALSEGETNLSSLRGLANRSGRALDRQHGLQASLLRSFHHSEAGQASIPILSGMAHYLFNQNPIQTEL